MRYYSTAASNVIIYLNPGKDQKSMLEDNRGRSGIYMWENKTNGKTYVGSSQDLRKRIQDYFDKHVLNYSGSKIYKAILKYGHDHFIFKVLEYCHVNDLMVREQYYLDTLQPEYNILKYAKSSRGYLHSEATKERLATARKEW